MEPALNKKQAFSECEDNDSGFDSSNFSSSHDSEPIVPKSQPLEMESSSSYCSSSKDSMECGYSSLNSSDSLHSNNSSNSSTSRHPTTIRRATNITSQTSSSSDSLNLQPKAVDRLDMGSLDSAYGSLPSSDSLSSRDGNLSEANKVLVSSRKQPAQSTIPDVDESRFYNGKPEEFLISSLGRNWLKWDPIRDIREKLGYLLLENIREIFWDQNADDAEKEFEALDAARDGDERAVALAVFVAKNHKQLNTMNKNRQTILHIAAECCTAPLVRLIITRGADGAIADAWGDTALHIAARLGRKDVIKALTTTLTKPEVRHPYYRVPYKSLPQDNVQSYNHDGRTPVHLAAQTPNSPRHRAALEALKKCARADMDYRRLGDGYAPAHIAIDNDDYECLKVCLEMGADSEVRNFKSETPQQLAYLCGSTKMVELCQEHGAGAYQLRYAHTESVSCDEDEDMDVDDDDECSQPMARGISHQLERMAVN